MQSVNIKINNDASTSPSPFHVKVSHNNEFRRFALESPPRMAQLEQTLRSLYALDSSLSLKVKFQDDENDWVAVSTDEELKYALELAGSPLRLSFYVLKGLQKTEKPEQLSVGEQEGVQATQQQEQQSQPPAIAYRGRGGKCGKGRGAKVGDVQERLTQKSSRLTERIQTIESRLNDNPSLTSERQRVLRWRLVQLQNKLSAVNEKKTSLQTALNSNPATAVPQTTPAPAGPSEPVRGCGYGRGFGRGRGCRGGRGHAMRGAFVAHEFDNADVKSTPTPTPNPGYEVEAARGAFTNFRQCKINLKVVRKSGNTEAIEACESALREAQERRKQSLVALLAPQRAHKRQCAINLRNAQKSGNESEVKAAQDALSQSISELQKAKADLLS